MRNIHLISLMAVLLSGCAVFARPAPTPTDTPMPLPTSTSSPTITPTPTLSGSMTPEASTTPFLFSSPTPGSSTDELSCKVLWQSIRNGRRYDPKQRFDMSWTVKNKGTATWDPDSIDFTYYSGAKLSVSGAMPIQNSVTPGDTITLLGDMVAPKRAGSYTTVWALRRGKEYFCSMSLRIKVLTDADE